MDDDIPFDIYHVRTPPLTPAEVQAIIAAPLDAPLTPDFTALIYVAMHDAVAGLTYADRHVGADPFLAGRACMALIDCTLLRVSTDAHAVARFCRHLGMAITTELAVSLGTAMRMTRLVWHIPLPAAAAAQPQVVRWRAIAGLSDIVKAVRIPRGITMITFETPQTTIVLSETAAGVLAAAGYTGALIDAEIAQLRDGTLLPMALLSARLRNIEVYDTRMGWWEYVRQIAAIAGVPMQPTQED